MSASGIAGRASPPLAAGHTPAPLAGAGRGSGGRPGTVSLGVDARGLFTTGVGRYMREVLAGVLADPRFGRVTLLGDPDELHGFVSRHRAADRVRVLEYKASWYTRSTQAAWLSLWRQGATTADVWFYPFADVPLVAHPRRSVATVHDVIGVKLAHLSSLKGWLATQVMLRGSAARASRLIAVSESTRRDIVEHVPRAARKTSVVYQGVGENFVPLGPAERLPLHIARLCPYLLCVGNRSLHKNHLRAVRALAGVRAQVPGLRLVVAGGRPDPTWDEVMAHARELGVADAVTDLGAVSESDLRHLYAGAEALLFPSLYEGFGLPVLEAMACGTPVVASNRSSMPEVAGDAGLLVDPDDPGGMENAVLRLAHAPELRACAVRRGLEHAARFTWGQTASRTADILHSAAGER